MAPLVIVFDVNETLSDMAPMRQHFAEVGVVEELAGTWFAALLRDGFALTSVGVNRKFALLAEQALRTVLHGQILNRSLEDAVAHIMAGLASLPVHGDVVPGIRALRPLARLVTLTNGSTSIADGLLERAGVRDDFEALLSVEDAPLWKPASSAYQYAAESCGTAVEDMLLVAVHPWDIDGAARAGMKSAWINRTGGEYPSYMSKPDYSADSLTALAQQLA